MKTNSLFLKTTAFLLLVSFLNLEIGCRYFKVQKMENLTEEVSRSKLLEMQQKNKYIILDIGSERYNLTNLELNQDKMKLTCTISQVDPTHFMYIPDVTTNRRYREKNFEWKVKEEVHILAYAMRKLPDDKAEINFSAITRIDIIDKDTGKTTASYVFGTIGILAGVAVILFIIALATKSSCPFVYVKDGQSYVFKGELYGGAIFKPIERDDFILLKKLVPDEKELKIKISNELKEKQYTDIAEAIFASYDPGVDVMMDNNGALHTIKNLVSPVKATLNDKSDCITQLARKDSNSCIFNAEDKDHFVNELQLSFNKPVDATTAKLVLNLKNTMWLDFVFGEFTKLFGMYYNSWIEKQRNENADSLLNWGYKQHLPLEVYVKKDSGWQLLERIPTIGPLASRDICVPVNISSTSNTIDIKLVCGFMFWEADYAAMDFSNDMPVTSTVLKPALVIDESGNNRTNALSYSDRNYLFQPGPGYEAEISYKLPDQDVNKSYKVFLHTRGFYEHVRDYEGLPDKKLLESFKQEGAFIDFSKTLYDEVLKNSSVPTAIN